ncbi:MAG: hypothetical protein ACTHJ4_07860 [Candidatus Nucleicultricaceae bacterium]
MRLIRFFLCLGLYFLSASYQGYTMTLWSWDRLDDFHFIDNKNVRIASLIATFKADKKGFIKLELRHQGFRRPKDVSWIAVFRIELRPEQTVQDRDIENMIALMTHLSKGAVEIQVDFDATKSQRPFYKKLMQKLHQSISIPLSMTALASWCTFDPWLDEMPVSYAVPMLYSLGSEKEILYQHLRAHGRFQVKKCRGYLGLNLSDLALLNNENIKEAHHFYFFNNEAWNPEHYKMLIERVK